MSRRDELRRRLGTASFRNITPEEDFDVRQELRRRGEDERRRMDRDIEVEEDIIDEADQKQIEGFERVTSSTL